MSLKVILNFCSQFAHLDIKKSIEAFYHHPFNAFTEAWNKCQTFLIQFKCIEMIWYTYMGWRPKLCKIELQSEKLTLITGKI